MIDKAAKLSGELFNSGFYCAESVLLAIAKSKKINSKYIPKIATGFCSGLSRTSNMCGAVSGAIMGISLFTGRNSAEDSEELNYSAVQQLLETFEKKFKSLNCYKLTGCDLSTEKGHQDFEQKNIKLKCLQFVEEATRTALYLIEKIE